MKFEPATRADHPAILALNDAALPHVNRISEADLAILAAQSFYFRIVRQDEQLAAFLLAFSQDASYDSPNFLWFQRRYPRFVYIDRIVVAPSCHRLGIGTGFYSDLERLARASAPALTCEVNLDPPNPGSLAFHERFGFSEVGRQHTDAGAKWVCLMSKPLDPRGS